MIVHYPKDVDDKKALENKVANIHVECILTYLNGILMTYEDKVQLINVIQNSYQS